MSAKFSRDSYTVVEKCCNMYVFIWNFIVSVRFTEKNVINYRFLHLDFGILILDAYQI